MKKIIGIILISVVSLIILTGCTSSVQSSYYRFEELLDDGICEIIYDRTTGVQYLIYDTSRGCGITVLVDENGQPLVYEGE